MSSSRVGEIKVRLTQYSAQLEVELSLAINLRKVLYYRKTHGGFPSTLFMLILVQEDSVPRRLWPLPTAFSLALPWVFLGSLNSQKYEDSNPLYYFLFGRSKGGFSKVVLGFWIFSYYFWGVGGDVEDYFTNMCTGKFPLMLVDGWANLSSVRRHREPGPPSAWVLEIVLNFIPSNQGEKQWNWSQNKTHI